MKNTKKDSVQNISFPDYLASDEDKNKKEYGLQMAKAIEYEWFKVPSSGGTSTYYSKKDQIHNLRLYGRGEQSTKIYKNLLNGGEEDSYSNYDWRPIQIIPKFVKLMVNQMSERFFNINAEAIDSFSTDLKDTYKKVLEDEITLKPLYKEIKTHTGLDLASNSGEEMPETSEEIELYMQLNYKPAIEIATEQAIKYTLELNDYDEVQSKCIEDAAVIGISAIKHTTDKNKGIVVKHIDPAKLVYSFPKDRNFKDVHYYGEVEKITVNELNRLSGGIYTKDELKDFASLSREFSSYQGNTNDSDDDDRDFGNVMVSILHFNFKSTNTLSYKKKYNKNGGYKMTKKGSTFSKKNEDYKGFDVSKKIIDVWYKGTLILGTKEVFNYGLCENMIRPKGLLNKSLPEYVVYASDIYQNRTKSLVERMIPYVDQLQQVHIKLQQLIAKTRPKGIYIDVDGLDQISLGDGNFLTPLEVVKIYDQTGNILGTSKGEEGDYNYGKEPIKELNNGVVSGLNELIGAYNHYLNMIRDAVGIPVGMDASMPHPDTLVGVQEQVALNSNTATRHILDSILNMSERVGEALALRLKDIFKYSDLKEVYTNSIGKINVDVLESIKNLHLHDLGINIELKPDSSERQMLENYINTALTSGAITLDDAIDIRSIDSSKIANQLLKVRRVRREKEKKEHEKDMVKQQSESQAEAAIKISQAKSQEFQAKSQSDMIVVQGKTQGKLQEIKAEEEAKSRLMEQEFRYNIQINQGTSQLQIDKENFKEDRKDYRQDRGNTQRGKLDEARKFGTPAPSFESSEDNISGSIEMGEMGPS
jgi:hypothetical protein